ncbi:MAG: nicotinamide-nucleotide adenylyltransferase [Candidatus Diapherotrites archaeon]
MRGLIVGRFQPYHLGHHNAVKNALKEVDELVIVIGSTDQSYHAENPFNTGERIEMISRALKADSLFARCFIVPVPNIDEFSLWVARVRSHCPSFETVYTNNPLVAQLFKEEKQKVKKMVSNHAWIDSKEIRKQMLEGGKWKELVPKAVAAYLSEINAVERINAIHAQEKKE